MREKTSAFGHRGAAARKHRAGGIEPWKAPAQVRARKAFRGRDGKFCKKL
jgi:hypothetical protein